MPILDVDTVCTHEDLANEIGSLAALLPLLPRDAAGDSHNVRLLAYSDVVKALARRAPPVHENDLDDPTQLRDAVAYGALARLYRAAVTTNDPADIHRAKWSHYQSLQDDEIAGLRPSVGGGSNASTFSIPFGRR